MHDAGADRAQCQVLIQAVTDCRKLWLGNNQLECLPDSMCRLVNLKHLFLEGNMLESIPECLSQIALEKLQISGNPLTHVQNWVKGLCC
jgi:Leucine-rich repeat (LRR) protein